MEKLTAIIPTFNEADNIERAIQSVRWADELMVVDSFSTDDTVEIAKKYTDLILRHQYINSATQKNWAIPQAKHPWVLILDADEQITPELVAEIKTVLSEKTPYTAFWIRRENYFMDKRIRFSGWQGDAVIRLFRRDLCKYQDLKVHAEIETTGKIGKLKGKIRHYTYKNLPTTLIKTEQYSTWKAYDKLDKVKKINAFHLFIKPVWKFIYHYFIKLGILDGRQGFIISVFSSFNVFLRAVKIWRLHKGEKLKKNL